MARVEVTTTFRPGFLKRLEREIEGSIRELGELIVKRIRDLAVNGRRMIEDGGEQSLPQLSQSYQEMRRGVAYFRKFRGNDNAARLEGRDPRLDNVDTFFRPRSGRSNLTFTGQLLDALDFRFDGNDLVIFLGNTSRNDTNLTNEQILDLLIARDDGYDIMNLSRNFREEILERIRRIINRELVKINS